MRQEHETATGFNQLQAITQAIHALKKGAPKNATNQSSANAKAHTQERTQTGENANASDPTQQSALKLKATACAKKGRLNPTKKAFSERQITAFRDNSQASELKRLQTNQANNSNLRAEPSNEAFKPGLAKHKDYQKGGKNEA
ncbi:hypothetical protein ACQJ51_05440 [Helicobacter pylori]|uniref:hypothetical protein n=1 Tax=Helicobacter pylori TaxID=210 RepID=UPI0002BBD65C|nr:hypothetical protein [Helicobacter pylori]EMG88270.1 hypothetical protein HMPREF1395_00942 [Helicobacter pylori GAM112Ai]EMH32085.1 hypothetical protein HMPREF1424_01353 [Helicobacter pylori GAM42Ai]MBH0253193.1 hypothetical protein [Helicobacter pylori]MBH0289122.1 hypothetical protein [Helicobacter pylori]OPG36651.1 hypothetical protein BGL64_02010 [Helicobacter pylori]